MIEREQIEIPVKKDTTDIVKKVLQLIKSSTGDTTKRAAALSQTAIMLADETDKAAQNVYVNAIVKETDVRKTDLKSAIKQIESDRKKKEKEKEKEEYLSKLDRYEMFLSKHFNIRYNEILMEFEITDKTNPEATGIDEYAILRAMRKENIEINEKTLIEILKSPYVDRYNPFRDYFNSLKDYEETEPDYISELANYLHLEDFDIFLTHFKKQLVRVVAGALEKQFNKQMMVLVGDGQYNQNSGKSTFIRYLVPEALQEYYLEDLPGDKDGLIALTDNFIINIDELESLARFEINKLKSIMSKETVKVRPPYGRRAIAIPRRASFFASTNELTFLSDLTGNVRWIVFKFKDVARPINWDYKKDIDINNVWRQAYYLFKSGYDYNLTRAEIDKNEERNFDFLTLPPEYDMINSMYLPAEEKTADVFYTTTDFMSAIHDQTRGAIKLNLIRLGKTLRKLGFKRVSNRISKSDNPVKGYYVKFHPDFTPRQTTDIHTIGESGEQKENKVRQSEMKLRTKQDDVPF